VQTASSRFLHYGQLADEALRAASATIDANIRAEFLDAAVRWRKLANDAERTAKRVAAGNSQKKSAGE
jgi:hypothetical protein